MSSHPRSATPAAPSRSWHHGSPAHRYGLYALNWITEANGAPTPDLDAFLAVVGKLGDGADVRLKVVSSALVHGFECLKV